MSADWLAGLTVLLPDAVPPLWGLVFVIAAFFTSALTAAAGLGGGVSLIAIMLMAPLSPAVVIPVHGVVQLGSNAGRTLIMGRHIAWPILLLFVAGAAVGAVVGAQMVVALNKVWLQLALGLFILWAVWTPKLKPRTMPLWGMAPAGAATTFASMFLGSTGPLVAVLLNAETLGRFRTVATFAGQMTAQHGLKVAAFGLVGFAYGEWLALMAAMVGMGFLGTLAGRWLLGRIPEAWFQWGFKAVITLLAARLIGQALV